jgi:hypothetical protein
MLLVVMRLIWYGYTCSSPIAAGRGGGLLLAQIVSTCLRGGYKMGGGGGGVRFFEALMDKEE